MKPNWSMSLPYSTTSRASLLQNRKTDKLDRSKLSPIEQSLPSSFGWYNTKTGQLATGMNVAKNPLNRWQENLIYPNDLAREKIQEQFAQAPLQYSTNPDGTTTASRSINSGYAADGISRGQALNYKWVLPKESMGAAFRQQNNPETDAQRSMMYDRGGAYSNMRTDVSPYRMTSASFRLPTTRDGSIGAQFGGMTNYVTGQQYAAGGIRGLGGFSFASFPAQYQRFSRSNVTSPFENYGDIPTAPASNMKFPEIKNTNQQILQQKKQTGRRFGLIGRIK